VTDLGKGVGGGLEGGGDDGGGGGLGGGGWGDVGALELGAGGFAEDGVDEEEKIAKGELARLRGGARVMWARERGSTRGRNDATCAQTCGKVSRSAIS
jgi:hypothetical protein